MSSSPKVSKKVKLEVLVPTVKILGPLDKFVDAGRNVMIKCIIENFVTRPTFVTWAFNGKVRYCFIFNLQFWIFYHQICRSVLYIHVKYLAFTLQTFFLHKLNSRSKYEHLMT